MEIWLDWIIIENHTNIPLNVIKVKQDPFFKAISDIRFNNKNKGSTQEENIDIKIKITFIHSLNIYRGCRNYMGHIER